MCVCAWRCMCACAYMYVRVSVRGGVHVRECTWGVHVRVHCLYCGFQNAFKQKVLMPTVLSFGVGDGHSRCLMSPLSDVLTLPCPHPTGHGGCQAAGEAKSVLPLSHGAKDQG